MAVSLTRKINDAGVKIGGARKDWAAERMLMSDVAAMTDEEKSKHITKDNVWPKPDYQRLVSEGMEPMAAALIKIIRDRVAKTPEVSRNIPYSTTLAWYFEVLSTVSRELESLKTASEVIGYYDSYRKAHVQSTDRATESTLRSRFFTIMKGAKHPLYVTFDDRSKANKLLAQGFPDEIPSWRKGYVAKKLLGREGFTLLKGKFIVQSGFESEGAAYEWLKARIDRDKAAKSQNDASSDGKPTKVPVRPHLKHIERIGLPDWREGVDVTPQMFIDTFGFRAVEFGEWLPDTERQQVLNFGYEALMDMAHVLGMTPGQISLDGTLAIAFGARGQGSAAAHYEAERRVINITKLSGAGAVAHEWGHALDHMLGTGSSVPMEVPSLSGWRGRVLDCAKTLAHRGDAIAQTSQELMRAILQRPLTKQESAETIRASVASFEKSTASYQNAISSYKEKVSAGTAEFSKSYANKLEKGLREQSRGLNHWKSQLEAILSKPEDAYFGNTASEYHSEACKISGSDGYWARPNELFARAFEAFIYSELNASGQSSNYLVAWADNKFFPEEIYKGMPYPSGDESSRINACFRRLVELTADFIPDHSEVKSHSKPGSKSRLSQ